jgi:DNA-binding NarL/FixJ family response regulator
MIKILIADDHETVRDGLKTFINEKNGFMLVGEAKNGKEAVDLTLYLDPDIVIMDISMPIYDGIKALELLIDKKEDAKVLIFSMHSNPQYITDAYQKGASGFLLKDSDKSEIILAIHKIIAGEKYFGSSVANTILGNLDKTNKKSKIIDSLTKRELEILKWVKKGLSNEQIAEKLFVSKRTIDTHKTNIKSKLQAPNTAALISITYELGL